RGPAHRALGALLNAVLLATFALVPLLDGIAVEYDAVIESEHGACDYVRIHDHVICVQFGSNIASAAPRIAPFGLHPRWGRVDVSPVESSAIPSLALEYERTRAPPLI
ncbi:MAG: hypothetical protein HKN73_17675, partial [Gemmatimonadetes bacterium]|nr:hypothetical protein [Gemmatimonadota bacterium]